MSSPPNRLPSSPKPSITSSPRIRHPAIQMPDRSPFLASPSSPGPASPAAIPDAERQEADLPLPMTASVVLTGLPIDAKKALAKASGETDGSPLKVTVFFQPLRDAPALAKPRAKITATQPFGAVVSFLRKKLRVRDGDGLWCYIDNFAPAPDEGVGSLFNCFKKGDELKVGYSITPTFG